MYNLHVRDTLPLKSSRAADCIYLLMQKSNTYFMLIDPEI